MEEFRNYRKRGTTDCPIAVYWGIAGINFRHHPNTEYHAEPEIVLVSRGSITMLLGGESKVFSAGDIFIISPNVVHWRREFSEDAKVWTMVFSPEAIRLPPDNFFQRDFVQPLLEDRLEFPLLLQPGHPAYDEIYNLMTQLDRCLKANPDHRLHRLRVLMCICLALMPYCQILPYDKAAPDPGHEAVRQCMRYIHKHYAEKLTLDAIASHCHLHPNYLCNVFKHYTGETVFEYRTRFRMEMAEDLLRREKLPVRKVAEMVGFRSECQFYKTFKAHTGVTPREYARMRKEQSV